VSVRTFGTGAVPDAQIASIVQEHFDLRPASMIAELQLQRPLYRQTAVYGHFGRPDLDLPWERTPHREALQRRLRPVGVQAELPRQAPVPAAK